MTLKFAEIFDTAAGQRYMNATLNGTTVFTNLDVWTAAGGKNRAYDLSYPVSVTNGQLTITLTCTSSNNSAEVNAIQIVAGSAPQQYYLTTAVSPSAGGTITPSGWYNSGSLVAITATPANGDQFNGFSGALSGMTNPQSLTIVGNAAVTANFTPLGTQYQLTTSPPGLNVWVNGAVYATPYTFTWNPGQTYTIATATPQSGQDGVQYLFSNWSDGGGLMHTVTVPASSTTFTANFTAQAANPNQGIAPTRLEVNLGPLPIEEYDGTTLNDQFPQCPGGMNGNPSASPGASAQTTRACMQGFLRGYAAQGVTGVRFQLALNASGVPALIVKSGQCPAGGGIGSVCQTWLNNLALFLQDLAAAGISRVTPTLAMMDIWSRSLPSDLYRCQQNPSASGCPITPTCAPYDPPNQISPDQPTSACPTVSSCQASNNCPGWFQCLQTPTADSCAPPTITTGCACPASARCVSNPNDPGCPPSGHPSACVVAGTGQLGKNLVFYPWLPFGYDPNDNYNTDGSQDQGNNAYACSPPNPGFWGWGPVYNLIAGMASRVQAAGLTLEELDLQNEANLTDFPIEARLVWDNTTDTPVFQYLGGALSPFSPTKITMSAPVSYPAGTDPTRLQCLSIYGDSAHLTGSSAILAASGGADIGAPPYVNYYGLMRCDASLTQGGCPDPSDPNNVQAWVTCATRGMIHLPAAQATPTVTDQHASPCVWNSSTYKCDTTIDATPVATSIYNGVWNFVNSRGLTGNTVMFGESFSNHPSTTVPVKVLNQNGTVTYTTAVSTDSMCDDTTQAMAQQSVNSYLASQLYSQDKSNVVFRPWNNAVGIFGNQQLPACQTPAIVGAPNGPYKQ